MMFDSLGLRGLLLAGVLDMPGGLLSGSWSGGRNFSSEDFRSLFRKALLH